jgi:hypothetical protein
MQPAWWPFVPLIPIRQYQRWILNSFIFDVLQDSLVFGSLHPLSGLYIDRVSVDQYLSNSSKLLYQL